VGPLDRVVVPLGSIAMATQHGELRN
jgi:hypothetical protein